MTPFTRLIAPALTLMEDRIDTDILFPARYLLLMEREGLGRYLCHDRRFAPDGTLADNPFDTAPEGTAILISGRDFGCGSSREQAVWAFEDFGFRAVFAESLGEIFAANCVNSGVLAVALPREALLRLTDLARDGVLTVDLPAERVGRGNEWINFAIPGAVKQRLLNGWDEVDSILGHSVERIAAFEAHRRSACPWL